MGIKNGFVEQLDTIGVWEEVEALNIDKKSKERIICKIDKIYNERNEWECRYDIQKSETEKYIRTCAYLASLLFYKKTELEYAESQNRKLNIRLCRSDKDE